MKSNKTCTIFNVGDVGQRLLNLLDARDYTIYVGKRQIDSLTAFESQSIHQVQFTVSSESLYCSEAKCFEANFVVIILPFKKNMPDPFEYSTWIKKIVEMVSKNKVEKLVFISSTSIYAKDPGQYNEEGVLDLETNRALALQQAEQQVMNMGTKACVLRPAGIVKGPLSKARLEVKEKMSPYQCLNLVHIDDIAQAICFVMENKVSGIFNLCASSQPSRYEYYQKCGGYNGFEFDFDIFNAKAQRKICNQKLKSLGFCYQFDDPLNFNF